MNLNSGPFHILYENGTLRYICHGETEIVRMMYFALRDENWATLPLFIDDEQVQTTPNGFSIRYTAFNRENGKGIFKWNAVIEGNSSGEIVFGLRGEALNSINKNRAGFCVLHPIRNYVGRPVEVQHPDGTITKSSFPTQVDPENRFKNIRTLKFKNGEAWFELAFEGDVFETEDQRNWTDASFKTFCTPSGLPIPVHLNPGDTITQKITFKPLEPLPFISPGSHPVIQLSKTGKTCAFPSLGLGASGNKVTLTPSAINRLRALQLDHYRIEVTPSEISWVSEFSQGCVEAFELQLKLEVALHLSSDYREELEAFTQVCLQNRVHLKKVLVLSKDRPVTGQDVIDSLKSIRGRFPNVLWGVGTNFNFNELNKNRFQPEGVNFISYGIHPQEHAFDDRTLIENLEGQSETALCAHHLYPGYEIHISPVTLRKRFNPYASDPQKKVLTENEKSDPRQSTPFAVHWTLGSLRALLHGGITNITYYQAVGPQGILSTAGEPHPVYELFLKLLPLRSQEVMEVFNSNPLAVDALLFSSHGKETLVMANHTNDFQHVAYGNKEWKLKPGELTMTAIT